MHTPWRSVTSDTGEDRERLALLLAEARDVLQSDATKNDYTVIDELPHRGQDKLKALSEEMVEKEVLRWDLSL